MAKLTAKRLREVLSYDPETGIFTWLVAKSHHLSVGDQAGVVCKTHGYRIIGIDGDLYRAARLAWFYMTGKWPRRYVDHISGDRSDDRWCNLRAATQSQNLGNMRIPKHNTSGLKGASYRARQKKWGAQIHVNGKNTHLGFFETKEEAHAAYCVAANKHFGEFARTA